MSGHVRDARGWCLAHGQGCSDPASSWGGIPIIECPEMEPGQMYVVNRSDLGLGKVIYVQNIADLTGPRRRAPWFRRWFRRWFRTERNR